MPWLHINHLISIRNTIISYNFFLREDGFLILIELLFLYNLNLCFCDVDWNLYNIFNFFILLKVNVFLTYFFLVYQNRYGLNALKLSLFILQVLSFRSKVFIWEFWRGITG